MARPCPACPRTRAAGHYLCAVCWFALSADARRQLNRRDGQAIDRLQQLYARVQEGVPLSEIQIR